MLLKQQRVMLYEVVEVGGKIAMMPIKVSTAFYGSPSSFTTM
jgi:hypothetical protein